eukprot:CAMPEP_0204367700 /NCGR_PEP_ID=MMETSP0469-20131031/43625_1 /ASSEMBLY_ACC=CAM_ASM_000384 /TAXON_ID=2969 /ORGANISM="Oxyrrhis marina" /LENGTH=259 /DNA_ID=CAMNT_0051357149 /DNA_START=775 /DNA_END=1550 /DNA_ORIENTATION=-
MGGRSHLQRFKASSQGSTGNTTQCLRNRPRSLNLRCLLTRAAQLLRVAMGSQRMESIATSGRRHPPHGASYRGTQPPGAVLLLALGFVVLLLAVVALKHGGRCGGGFAARCLRGGSAPCPCLVHCIVNGYESLKPRLLRLQLDILAIQDRLRHLLSLTLFESVHRNPNPGNPLLRACRICSLPSNELAPPLGCNKRHLQHFPLAVHLPDIPNMYAKLYGTTETFAERNQEVRVKDCPMLFGPTPGPQHTPCPQQSQRPL